jgi:hypothetical protein
MKMRHALAYAIIDRHECTVSIHSELDRTRKYLSISKVGTYEFAWEIGQRFEVFSRYQENMTGKNGSVIEKGDARFVFEDDWRLNRTGNDAAENTAFVHLQEFAEMERH